MKDNAKRKQTASVERPKNKLTRSRSRWRTRRSLLVSESKRWLKPRDRESKNCLTNRSNRL